MKIDRSVDILSKDEIIEFCHKKFNNSNDENFKVINYEYNGMDGTPKGFLGDHSFLNVTFTNDKIKSDGIQNRNLIFFVKSVPNVEAQMQYCEGFSVFKKETNVYKYVIPLLVDINKKNNHYFAPECYLVKDKVLVFENLAEQGFRCGTMDGGLLDYDHLLCVMKTLAIFHSSSILLEQRKNKSIIEMHGVCVEENSYPSDPNNMRSILFKNASAALIELLKSIPKYQNHHNLDYLVKSFESILARIFEFVKPSKKFRNVFSHGDLWANNIMFKYSSNHNNGKNTPIDCRLVDFQLARYSPPILDVITVLTIPTTSEFRQKHIDDLLQKYYKFLTQCLAENDINIEEVLSAKEYKESIEHFKLAGLIESCLFSHLTVLPESVASNLFQSFDNFNEFLTKFRSQICLKAFKNSKIYRDRMTDMISDIVDNYILNLNAAHEF